MPASVLRTPPPFRLPAGWSVVAAHGGSVAVAGPAELGPPGHAPRVVASRVSYDQPQPPDARGLALHARAHVAALAGRLPDLLLLDESAEGCRGDRPAHRVLYTCSTEPDHRSLTVEHWVVAGDDALHVLSAAVATAAWPALAATVRSMLRSYRGAAVDGEGQP